MAASVAQSSLLTLSSPVSSLPVSPTEPSSSRLAGPSASLGKLRTVPDASTSSGLRHSPDNDAPPHTAIAAMRLGDASTPVPAGKKRSISRTPSPSPSGSSSSASVPSPLDTPLAGHAPQAYLNQQAGPYAGSPTIQYSTPIHLSASSTDRRHRGPGNSPGFAAPSGSASNRAHGLPNGYAHHGPQYSDRMPNGVAMPPATNGAYGNHLAYGGVAPSQAQATAMLAGYLAHSYLPSIMPSPEEYADKESTRQSLEALVRRILPGSALIAFGSTANGLSLRNSDMDLCCVMADRSPLTRSAAELVEELGAVIMSETNYQVRMLARARIPIIKLTIPPSAASPLGMACDIGFDNKLAIENTNLLLTYVMVDARLRTMVLFLKLWTKRRKINNPYLGTLSSYGYALLTIFYLAHVRRPPVLPNLQRIPPQNRTDIGQASIDGHDAYFYKDIAELRRSWPPVRNQENVGELLIGFFAYIARDFRFTTDVISIRSDGGLLTKDAKGWTDAIEIEGDVHGRRDNTCFCIEDPFQLNYNVARTVTKDGVYTIRSEFLRAVRLLCDPSRAERPGQLIAELCEEREEGLIPCPPGAPFSAGGRRQSAPSPQLPFLNATQAALDYRAYTMANGIVDGPPGGRPGQLPLRGPVGATLVPPSVFEDMPSPEQVRSLALEQGMSPMPPRSHGYATSPRMRQRPSQQGFQQPPLRRRESGNVISSSASAASSSAAASPPAPPERRLSSDSTTTEHSVLSESSRFAGPSSYTANGVLGVSLGPPPAQAYTAPTSPVMRAAQFLPPPLSGGQLLGSSVGSSTGPYRYAGTNGWRAPRSQSHSASDRMRYVTPFQDFRRPPQWGSLMSPTVNGLGLFDSPVARKPVAPPNQEEHKRPGMARVDDLEVITFGQVRMERQPAPRRSVASPVPAPRRLVSDGQPPTPASNGPSLSPGRSLASDLALFDMDPRKPIGPASVP